MKKKSDKKLQTSEKNDKLVKKYQLEKRNEKISQTGKKKVARLETSVKKTQTSEKKS